MQHKEGDPIHGELHSTDASAGVEIVIYNAGSLSARTLASNEYIEIDSLEVVSVAGGDTKFFLGATSTPTAGEYAVRATLAAGGGLAMSSMNFVGANGSKPYLTAPAGVVDVNFVGRIRKGKSEGTRPAWKPAQKTAGA